MTAPIVTRHDRPGDPEPPKDTPPPALSICMAWAPGRRMRCAATLWHDGPHAVFHRNGEVFATWPQEPAS